MNSISVWCGLGISLALNNCDYIVECFFMTTHSWILVTPNCLSIMLGKVRIVGYIILKTPKFFEFLFNPLCIAHSLPNLCGLRQELGVCVPRRWASVVEGPVEGRARLLTCDSPGAGVTTAKMTQHAS